MTAPGSTPGLERPPAPTIVAIAAIVVVLVGMHFAASVIFLLSLSSMVALLLLPAIGALQRRGASGGVSLALAMLLYLLTIALVVVLLVLGVAGFMAELPAQEPKLTDGLAGLIGGREQASVISTTLVGIATALADALLGTAVLVGLSIFVVAYLLLEARRGSQRLQWAFPGRPNVIPWAQSTADQLRTYLLARVLLGAIAAVLDTILLLVLGVPSALLWGVLSFLMSFVPNVGFFIAMIPPTVLGFAVGGAPTALFVIVGYIVINLTMDYVIQPRFIGAAVNLSAVVVTLSVFFWAVVLGPQGAMLAVPLTVIAANLAPTAEPEAAPAAATPSAAVAEPAPH
jgi:AI-2 transport protein TqsA